MKVYDSADTIKCKGIWRRLSPLSPLICANVNTSNIVCMPRFSNNNKIPFERVGTVEKQRRCIAFLRKVLKLFITKTFQGSCIQVAERRRDWSKMFFMVYGFYILSQMLTVVERLMIISQIEVLFERLLEIFVLTKNLRSLVLIEFNCEIKLTT